MRLHKILDPLCVGGTLHYVLYWCLLMRIIHHINLIFFSLSKLFVICQALHCFNLFFYSRRTVMIFSSQELWIICVAPWLGWMTYLLGDVISKTHFWIWAMVQVLIYSTVFDMIWHKLNEKKTPKYLVQDRE